MKAAVCLVGLCLLAGIVSADFAWETGKQYRYSVWSRALVGVTEIDNKYTGLQLKYNVLVTPTGGNTVNVQTEQFQAVQVNERMPGGWREDEIQQGQQQQLPREIEQYLTAPMDIVFQKGVVESIKVPQGTPVWVENVKKSIASFFTIDSTGKNAIIKGNLNRQTPSHTPEEANQESGFFWKSLEETVHGECETYYTVSQNGPFDSPYQFQKQAQPGSGSASSESQEVQGKRQAQSAGYRRYRSAVGASSSSSSSESSEESSGEKAWPKAFEQLCEENDQVYEIIKTVNFTTCNQKPVLAYSTPAGLNYHAGDNAGGSIWGRALVTRIVACGQSRQNFTILKITQQERFHTGLLDTEKIIAGVQNNVTLISIQRQGQAQPVQNGKTIENLVYKYSKQAQESLQGKYQHGGHQSGSQSESQESQGHRRSPRSVRQQSSSSSSSSSSQESGSAATSESSSESSESQEQEQKQFHSGSRGQKIQGQLPMPSMDEAPLSPLLITPVSRSQVKARAAELIQEIASDLVKPTESSGDSMAERETVSKVATLVKALRQLKYQEIQSLAGRYQLGQGQQQQQHQGRQQRGGQQEQQQEVSRNICLESMNIAGTNPAVKFLIKLIKSGELSGEQAAQIVSQFPMYIRTPTPELMQQLFQLIDDQQVKQQQQVRTSLILAFSVLANQACVNKRIKNTRYPVALYGEFCDEEQVSRKYVPYFIQKLEKRLQGESKEDIHYTFVMLKALANFGVPAVIEPVQKILDEESNPLIKVKAIYALQKLVQSRQQLNQQEHGEQEHNPAVDRQSYDPVTNEIVEKQVLPILAAAAFDRGEHPEVRMAAFDSLFYCSAADTALWQQIAMSTWFEPNRNVLTFVVNTLEQYAQLKRPLRGATWIQQRKARAVLPLAKPIDGSLARPHNLVESQFFEEVNSGFKQQLQWIQGEDSLIPNYFYYKSFFRFGNGAAGVAPLKISLAGNTISKLLTAFIEKLGQGESQEELQKHQELHQIKQLLNIEPREQDTPVVGTLHINLRNEMQRLFTFDEQTVEKLAQQLARFLQHGKQQTQVNYQKPALLADHLATMPTAMGIPLEYRVSMPALVSVRGQLQYNSPSGPEYSAQADLQVVYAWKVHRRLAFKCPLTGKKYQAGVQRHLVVEAPFTAVARRGPHGSFQLAITPAQLSKGKPSGTIDLVTYHQKPYTSIVTDELYPISYPKGGKMELVRAPEHPSQEMYQNQRTFGQSTLGLALKLKEKTDFPEQKETFSGWAKFFQRFHTPGCAFNAAWLGSPSIRYAERKWVLNIDESETKTLVLIGAAQTQRVSIAQKLQSSEESSSETSESQSQEGQSQQQSSSSSSESQEGKMFFQNVRSRQQRQQQQHQQQQRRQQQQQSGSQSQSQSRESGSGSSSSSSSQSSSSSESGSYESSSESESMEGTQHRVSAKNVLAIALLGKKNALDSLDELKGQTQKALQPGSPNTVQYLLQIAQSAHGKLFIQAAIGDAANQAAQNLPKTKALQALANHIIQGQNSQSQPDACFELEGTIDTPKEANRHILFIRRQTLLQQNLVVKVQAKIQAGPNCRTMPVKVQIQGKLSRDQEQTEWAKSQSRKAKKCQQDEQKGFSVSPVCLEVAEQQAAALNVWEFTIQHSNIPQGVKNMTNKIENMLQAVGYVYMQEDAYPQSSPVQKGELKIKGRMTPDKKFVSVHIYKPNSVLKFENMKTNQWVRTVLPLTASQSIYENIKDRLLRSQSDPQCTLENNYVSTFDNVTYSFNPQAVQGCQTVLAKDCSGRYPMAVLVKKIEQQSGQVVTILLGGGNKIQLIPSGQQQQGSRIAQFARSIFSGGRSGSQSSQGMTVKVNGQQVQLPKTIRASQQKTGEPIAEIMEMPNGGVQVIGRRIQVASDGKRIGLVISHELRNRTCGVCGDFDNVKVAEMRSPRDVPLSSGSLLVASYSFAPLDKSSQCQVNPELEKQIQQEEQLAEPESRYSSKVQQRGQHWAQQQQQRRQQQQQYRQQQQQQYGQQYQQQQQPRHLQQAYQQRQQQQGSSSSSSEEFENQSSPETSESSSSSETSESSSQESQEQWQQQGQQSQKFESQQRAFQHPNKSQLICFTLNKIKKCARGYKPEKMVQKNVTVYCMPKSSQQTQALQKQVEGGQFRDFSSKQQHEQLKIAVPEQCVRA